MKLQQTTLLLAVGDGADPPSEFRIFGKGETKTSKGTVVFDGESEKLVLKAYAEHGADLMVDYEHKSLMSTPAVDGGKAAGWFKPEVREGELWAANVQWNPAAEQAIRNREYRYFSPAVLHDSKGRVHKLINVALTNLPATKNLRALVASDDATKKERTQMEPNETEVALFAALQVDSLSKALGTITALREEADKVKTLSARVTELEQAIAANCVDKLLLDAKDAGKVSEAELPKLREQGVKDVTWLTGYLAVKSPAPAAAPEHREPKDGELTTLTAEEIRVCHLMGMSHEDYIATKKRLTEQDAARAQETN